MSARRVKLEEGRRRDRIIAVVVLVVMLTLTGILAQVSSAVNAGGAWGLVLMFGPLGLVLVLGSVYFTVREAGRAEALAEIQRRSDVVRPLCRGCGYELRFLTCGRCPECGRVFQPAAVADIQKVVEQERAKERTTPDRGSRIGE